MEKLTTVGRTFFAIALIGLGIDHFIFQEFVTGHAPPWPASIPGGPAWAYLTGLVLIAASVAILAGRQARLAALLVGALIFTWAWLRQIPLVAADSLLGPTWTSAARALKMSGGAWAIAATLPAVVGSRDTPLLRFMNRRHAFVLLGRIGLASHMIVAGILHFMFTEGVASLIPGWFPGNAVFWTYFAAVALIAGGIGINVPRTAWPAALLSGLMIFSWFWIVHVPRTLLSASDARSVFGALASAGIAFVLAGYARDDRQPRTGERIRSAGKPAGVAASADR